MGFQGEEPLGTYLVFVDASLTVYLDTIPALRCGPVWQWNSHVPTLSGSMSATTMSIGSSGATSVRMWRATTVLPCQCGACISKLVDAMRYQRTFWPFCMVKPGVLPYTNPLIVSLRFATYNGSAKLSVFLMCEPLPA